jgi:hypothetical protein
MRSVAQAVPTMTAMPVRQARWKQTRAATTSSVAQGSPSAHIPRMIAGFLSFPRCVCSLAGAAAFWSATACSSHAVCNDPPCAWIIEDVGAPSDAPSDAGDAG